MNGEIIIGLVTAGLTLVAIVFAYIIPKRIMSNQLFTDLVAEYRTPEMGGAILALFHFYDECLKKKTSLDSEYEELYNKQIKHLLDNGKKVDFANTLHFQRRLVSQFYADMADLYAENSCNRSLIKKINKWFTYNELQLLKILLLLAQPANNVFIKVDVTEPSNIEVQMYKSIRLLYDEVSKYIRKNSGKH